MRNRSTMVAKDPVMWLAKVSTPNGLLLKFKGTHMTEEQFKNKVLDYFAKNDPNIVFSVEFIEIKKTTSYRELDNPSVIEI